MWCLIVSIPDLCPLSYFDIFAKTEPRMPTDCGLVPVELSEKLEYRGHTIYQSLRPDVVLHALHTRKENNPCMRMLIRIQTG